MKRTRIAKFVACGIIWVVSSLVGASLVAAQSPSASSYYEQGLRENRQGLLVAASVSFTEALGLRPDYAEAYLQRGLSFEGMGRVDAAIRDYTAAIDHGSKDLLPYQKLFAWCRSQQQYDRGVQLAKELVQNVPDNAAAGFWEMGGFHELMEEHQRALAAYRSTLQHLPAGSSQSVEDRQFRRAVERRVQRLERP